MLKHSFVACRRLVLPVLNAGFAEQLKDSVGFGLDVHA
jgi:hypothetical protein